MPQGSEPRPALPLLSRTGHDRAGLRRNDAQWLADAWPAAHVLRVGPDGTAAAEHGRLDWATGADADHSLPRYFLGEYRGAAYFAVLDASIDQALNLREAAAELDELDVGLFTAAVALQAWHARHTHCPRCGARTDIVDAGWARRCPVDGTQHFPRTDPAVIMLIHDGDDRCVLGRQATWPDGRFSILAGFVEAGESAESAVAREVYEEVGLRVDDVSYRASQPWPFPASLMLGFTAQAVGDLTIGGQDDELAAAGWFTSAQVRAASTWTGSPAETIPVRPGTELQALPGSVSIARMLIDEWLDAR